MTTSSRAKGALRPVRLIDPARHSTDRFRCGVASLGSWLRTTSPTATAATHVLCRGSHGVGYYSLAMGSVQRETSPSRLGRGQPDPVPVVLLARLALATAEHGTGLGGDLLRDAVIRSVAGAKGFGARALVVDAIDQSARAFYVHHGFRPLEGSRLYRRISDIKKTIDATASAG